MMSVRKWVVCQFVRDFCWYQAVGCSQTEDVPECLGSSLHQARSVQLVLAYLRPREEKRWERKEKGLELVSVLLTVSWEADSSLLHPHHPHCCHVS